MWIDNSRSLVVPNEKLEGIAALHLLIKVAQLSSLARVLGAINTPEIGSGTSLLGASKGELIA